MRIADVTLFYAPNSGGVKTYLEAKRSRIQRLQGAEHYLIIPGRSSSKRDNVVTIAAPPMPFSEDYRFPIRTGAWVRALRRLNPDIIEAADPYVPGWAVQSAARKLDIPAIAFYHSDLMRLVGQRLGRLSEYPVASYVRRFYRSFDRVLAPSQVMADTLLRCGLNNVHVQPLGVDLAMFNPEKRDPGLRAKMGIPEDRKLLIFAGRNAWEKRIPLLLETMRHLGSSYHLLLIGAMMPKEVPDNVSVIDHFTPAAELSKWMASADALIHGGDLETFGLIALEAMASGIPVVGVKAGALAEIVPEHCGVLGEPNNPASLADAVRSLFTADPAALGRQARRHVEQRYGWDAVVDSLLGHYRAVLKPGPSLAWQIANQQTR